MIDDTFIKISINGCLKKEFNQPFTDTLGKDYDAGWLILDVYDHVAVLTVSQNWLKIITKFEKPVLDLIFSIHSIHAKKMCDGCWNKFGYSRTQCFAISPENQSCAK